MQTFFHSLGVVIGKMLRALVIWGVVIGGAAIAWVGVQAHHLPSAAEWGLVGLAAVVGGLLGAVSRLAWELTHISQVVHTVRNAQSRIASHTQPVR